MSPTMTMGKAVFVVSNKVRPVIIPYCFVISITLTGNRKQFFPKFPTLLVRYSEMHNVFVSFFAEDYTHGPH